MRATKLLTLVLACFSILTNAQENNGIHISTSTSYDYYSHKGVVSVETFVEGESKQISLATPLEIILVLDVSGSMAEVMSGEKFIRYDDFDKTKPTSEYYDRQNWMGITVGGYVTKLGRMMDASYSFIESIEANSQMMGLDHKVGIVTFSSTSSSKVVMELTSVQGNLEEFKKKIYGFKASGATASDEGLRKAIGVYQRSTSEETTAKAILMFTDGEPTDRSSFQESVANDAITAALELKNTYGARCFAVGMFSGKVEEKVEKYMNGVSSNYPDAKSMDSLGEKKGEGYYTNVTQSENLSSIFDGISENIIVGGAKVDLSEETQIRDYMPPYMQLPKGTSVEDIHIYTCRCVGYDPTTGVFSFSTVREPIDLGPDGITISEDEDGCALVSVTGFNYKEHWCGPGMTSGRKLIVNIPFVLSAVNDGEFNPNRHESGLYDPEGNPTGSFDVQTLRFYDLTVECSGLLTGESVVYRLTEQISGKILCRFAINGESTDNNLKSKTLKNVPEGDYCLIEEGWNWAYTTAPSKTVNFTLDSDKTIHFDETHKTGTASPLHTEVHRSGR